MKEKIKTLFFLLGFFMITAAVAQSGSQQLPKWEFGNFGANSEGSYKLNKKNISIITNNTRHCFFNSDFYSFVYTKQKFLYDDCSKSTVSVKVLPFKIGSAGIMMRSDLGLGATNVHLEVNALGDIFLFYRPLNDEVTSYKRIAKVNLPIELKLIRQGSVFTGFYKNEKGEWVKGTSVISDIGVDPITGFYACSGSESQIGYSEVPNGRMDVEFTDWKFDYEENYIPAEKNYTDQIPFVEGTLLRDNFNDGSLSNFPESVINPVWKGIKYAYLPKDQSGGRYWHKTGDGLFYLGDKKWADYQVSIDLCFDSENKSPKEFMMQLRYQNIAIYSKLLRYYAVGVRNGNKLFFEKNAVGRTIFSKEVSIEECSDGKWHKLKVWLLDKKYQVYFDEKLLIEGVDEEKPITYGNVSLKFTNVSMGIDNLEIMRIDDPINGANDNYLLDYFDTPIPGYLKKYGY